MSNICIYIELDNGIIYCITHLKRIYSEGEED